VRPQPKQRLVLGSIIQTAMHGVSLLIVGYWSLFGRLRKVADLGFGISAIILCRHS
jgi:hypothetical protein